MPSLEKIVNDVLEKIPGCREIEKFAISMSGITPELLAQLQQHPDMQGLDLSITEYTGYGDCLRVSWNLIKTGIKKGGNLYRVHKPSGNRLPSESLFMTLKQEDSGVPGEKVSEKLSMALLGSNTTKSDSLGTKTGLINRMKDWISGI